jgi:hypothetical protein
VQEPFVSVRGRLQLKEGVTSVYAFHVERMPEPLMVAVRSHDFH